MFYAKTDNLKTIIVAAADIVAFEQLRTRIASGESLGDHYKAASEPDPFDFALDQKLNKFDYPVLVIEHASKNQQEQFHSEHAVKLTNDAELIVHQKNMRSSNDDEMFKVGVDDRSIREIYGLDKHDPWDKRTDEQKAQDALRAAKAKEAQKQGSISGDSFTGDENAPEPEDSNLYISNVKVTQHKDGSLTVDRVNVIKDENRKPVVKGDDEDISIASNGSVAVYVKVSIEGHKIEEVKQTLIDKGHDPSGTIIVSRNNRAGSWFAVLTQKTADAYAASLVEAGMTATVSVVDENGEELLPDGVKLMDDAFVIPDLPRPWSERSAEYEALSDDEKANLQKTVVGHEFYFTTGYQRDHRNLMVYICPIKYFDVHGDMYPHSLNIQHLLPAGYEEVSPGVYKTYETDDDMIGFKLSGAGFAESLILKLYFNVK